MNHTLTLRRRKEGGDEEDSEEATSDDLADIDDDRDVKMAQVTKGTLTLPLRSAVIAWKKGWSIAGKMSFLLSMIVRRNEGWLTSCR